MSMQGDLLDAAECAKAIRNYSELLTVFLAQPDASTAVDGMHQVMLEVSDLARTLDAILARVITSDASIQPTTEAAA